MTENPSVPSPPGLPQLPSNATSTPTPEEAPDTSGEIRCICEYTDDDGYTICCDKCETWQHLVCMQLSEDNVPKQYQCANCSPRPVDARSAKELQQRRRRDEEHDRGTKANVNNNATNKRKRTTGTSHKKKEAQSNGPNGVSSKTMQNAERTAPKLPSPRESQAPTSRKRTQRASHSLGSTANNASSSGQMSSANSPYPDRNGDAESDTDFEKFKYDYLDISNEPDRYESEEVAAYLLELAVADGSSPGAIPDEPLRRSTSNEFLNALPKTSVRGLDDSSKTYSDKQRWCLVLDTPCTEGRPVTLFRGQVGFQDAYKRLPTNQYDQWNHPKPHVIFHPDLKIYVDARGWGSQARFVRRSCRPNVVVNSVVLDGSKVRFGLYAIESLKAGTELAIGWDWDTSKYLQQLADADFDFLKMTTYEIRQAADWVCNLLDKVGDCACAGGSECLLVRTKKAGVFEMSTIKTPTTNGNTRKQKVKRNSSAEPHGSKEPTPDRHSTLHDNDAEDSRAGSTATKVKSRSRDLTPSLAQETAVEHGIMTGREARKFKDVLSRIEKQEQEDSHPQSSKRRKRNSTVCGSISVLSPSPVIENLKVPEKHKKKAKDRSRGPTPHFHEVSVTDASTGRRASHSSNGSEPHKPRRASSPTADSSVSSVVRRKVVSRDAKLKYVDSCMQTETDDDLPWWLQPTQQNPRREPIVPLRKRLMQSLMRDQAAAAASPLEKKRKLNALLDCSGGSPPKAPKLDSEAMEIGIAPNAPGPPPAVAMSAPSEMLKVEPISPGSSPSGPLLQIFSDSYTAPLLSGVPVPMKPLRAPLKQPQQLANGVKGPGLHLQLPPSSGLVNNSSSTQSPLSLGSAPLFSPSVASALGGVGAAPSPTRTKKLSLGDYSKRKHKSVDTITEKKDEEKPQVKISADFTTNKPLPFLDGPRKLADILTPQVDKLATPSTPQPSLDPPIGAERAANQWSVR